MELASAFSDSPEVDVKLITVPTTVLTMGHAKRLNQGALANLSHATAKMDGLAWTALDERVGNSARAQT